MGRVRESYANWGGGKSEMIKYFIFFPEYLYFCIERGGFGFSKIPVKREKAKVNHASTLRRMGEGKMNVTLSVSLLLLLSLSICSVDCKDVSPSSSVSVSFFLKSQSLSHFAFFATFFFFLIFFLVGWSLSTFLFLWLGLFTYFLFVFGVSFLVSFVIFSQNWVPSSWGIHTGFTISFVGWCDRCCSISTWDLLPAPLPLAPARAFPLHTRGSPGGTQLRQRPLAWFIWATQLASWVFLLLLIHRLALTHLYCCPLPLGAVANAQLS